MNLIHFFTLESPRSLPTVYAFNDHFQGPPTTRSERDWLAIQPGMIISLDLHVTSDVVRCRRLRIRATH